MSKTNKHKPHSYATANGEEFGTLEYKITVRDFNKGYKAGKKDAMKAFEDLRAAKKLIREAFKIPQNQPWNVLYPEGQAWRRNAEKFLSK
jgi:hypothetical protein